MRWGGIFDIDSKRVEVEEEELRTHVPDFWEHADANVSALVRV